VELEAVSGTAARCVEPVEEADADDFDHDSSRRASRARAVSRERGQEELRGERKRRSAVVAAVPRRLAEKKTPDAERVVVFPKVSEK